MSPRRLIIGVAGGSGSGKTTVVRRIIDSLGPDEVTVLDQDRYQQAVRGRDHPLGGHNTVAVDLLRTLIRSVAGR
jgi:uridine kinase